MDTEETMVKHLREKTRIRFWSKVHQPDEGCWEWKNWNTAKEYPKFRFYGRMVGSHRVAWMLERGDIPENMHVLHTCDNPKCVRPDHLFLGDHQANMNDMMTKRRIRKPITGDSGQVHLRIKDKELLSSIIFEANRAGMSGAATVTELIRDGLKYRREERYRDAVKRGEEQTHGTR